MDDDVFRGVGPSLRANCTTVGSSPDIRMYRQLNGGKTVNTKLTPRLSCILEVDTYHYKLHFGLGMGRGWTNIRNDLSSTPVVTVSGDI